MRGSVYSAMQRNGVPVQDNSALDRAHGEQQTILKDVCTVGSRQSPTSAMCFTSVRAVFVIDQGL
jgi:hypothetical protein